MLAFLVNTEAKLKQWTKKLAYEEDVQKVLTDYNVGSFYVVQDLLDLMTYFIPLVRYVGRCALNIAIYQ